MDAVLELTNVCKRYDELVAVNDISFTIREGTVTGFIGPNGAGKTTTIKMIMGLIRPTSGKILVNGHDVLMDYEKAAANLAGIVETPSFYPYLSGYDNLMQSYRIYKNIGKERLNELINKVGLQGRIHDKVRKYSLGMKQRLGICRALIGTPKILLLDEPINGLDLDGVIEFRDLIKNIVQKENCSILISSHILSEVEKICDSIIIINKGQIKHAAEFNANAGTTYRIVSENSEAALSLVSRMPEHDGIDGIDSIQCRQYDAVTLDVSADSQTIARLIAHLDANGVAITSFAPITNSLETEYMAITQEPARKSMEDAE